MKKHQTYKCPLCGKILQIWLIPLHEEECLVLKTQMSKAQKKAHAQQSITCFDCGMKVPFSLYPYHLEDCSVNQLSLCQFCGTLLPSDIFPQHQAFCEAKIQIHEPQFYEQQQEIIFEEKQKPKGLTKAQIQSLRPGVLLKSQQCSICQAKMTKANRTVSLRCKHIFHRKCIEPWLMENPKCPMCRTHAIKK